MLHVLGVGVLAFPEEQVQSCFEISIIVMILILCHDFVGGGGGHLMLLTFV